MRSLNTSMIYIITGVYGGPSALPTVVAGKCDGSTCSTLTTDVTAVKSCLTDPTASDCTGY